MSVAPEPQPASTGPGEHLPSVQPPSPTFILQLFLIPLIIVSIIVAVWFSFSWLAHAGSNPHDLVRNLQRADEKGWQDAATLAQMLREKPALADDSQLAKEIAELLGNSLKAGSSDKQTLQLRVYLCHALSAFRSREALPVLVKAAREERTPEELQVRVNALMALAVFIRNQPDSLANEADLFDVLRVASRERDEQQSADRAALRTAAAYSLGILGGDPALERLKEMVDDPNPNVRYNAATGLARHGSVAAIPMLCEMLDPTSEQVVLHEEPRHHESKRMTVLVNGIEAAKQLLLRSVDGDVSNLVTALEKLEQADVPKNVRVAAGNAVQEYQNPTRKRGM